MAITVKGYTKRLHGHLVTVSGYEANNRDSDHPQVSDGQAVHSTPESVERQAMNIAPPGNFPFSVDPTLRSTRGITAYQVYPEGMAPSQPIIRWRLSPIPIAGAYKIPKRATGAQGGRF